MHRSVLVRLPRAIVLAGLVLIAPHAKAETVVELFTSHGCSSCPPAEALLSELIAKDDSLIALEYHVDYWNSLIYGSAGNWVDPFSQIVVNGRYAMVGSDRNHVGAAIQKTLDSDVSVSIERQNNEWRIRVDNKTGNQEAADAKVWLVRYRRSVTTNITAGENKGLEIENHNVVMSMDSIGAVPQAHSVVLGASVDESPEFGCAVLVQDDFQSPILAAAKCPG